MPPKLRPQRPVAMSLTPVQAELLAAAEAAAPAPRRYRTMITQVHDDRDADRWVIMLSEKTVRFLEDHEAPMDTSEHLLNMVYWCEMNNFANAQAVADVFQGDDSDSNSSASDSSSSDSSSSSSRTTDPNNYHHPRLLPEAKAWLDATTQMMNNGLLWCTTDLSDGPFDLVYTWRSHQIR